MIQSVTLIKPLENIAITFDSKSHKVVIDLSQVDFLDCNSFDIKIVFSDVIAQFRSHDYIWKKLKSSFIANEFSPKIIKLQNEQIVQANIAIGIWEIDHDNPAVLLWRFNPELASPITNYLDHDNRRNISQARQNFNFLENPALLFPVKEAIELSRSQSPFMAIACFTDHCDFDTLENLITQRHFFKEYQIKITKGFFLNHFSKREENASFQNQKEELLKWHNDGHELCYHSLSQSIKSTTESFENFRKFIPPLENIKVWIDHGYQPYNLSLFKNNNIPEEDFSNILKEKKINILWNYIDSGTSTNGVINQFNTEHFTLSSFLNGNKDLRLVKRMQLMIKNIIFHYYNDENMILQYKNAATNFKKVFFEKKLKSLFSLCRDFLKLSTSILLVFLFWKTNKIKPYKLAKYSPILFKHNIAENDFYIFQTLEMLDFKKSLSKQNIESLISEKGVFVAHTYFSVPMEYHKGKLFSSPNKIDDNVAERFNFLSNKIKSKEIWNPTLTELVEYWEGFEKVVLDVDDNGFIFLTNNSDLTFRRFT